MHDEFDEHLGRALGTLLHVPRLHSTAIALRLLAEALMAYCAAWYMSFKAGA
jgi:hypothetical protein